MTSIPATEQDAALVAIIEVRSRESDNPPRLSIIIPHRGNAELLADCFTALAAQTEAPWEIIVGNNGDASENTVIHAVSARHGLAVVVTHAEQIGAGPARNAGVAVANGEWLAFIDSDCRPTPSWVAAGRRALAVHPLFGGRIVVEANDAARPTAVEAFDLEFGLDAERFLRRAGHLLTPNLFCVRGVFDRVGPFRASVPEDREWSYRAAAAGINLCYVASAVVVHPALATWPQLAFRWRRMTREEHCWSRERRFGRLGFWLRSWLVLGSVVPHSVRLLRSRQLHGVSRLSVIGVLVKSRIDRFILAQQLVLRDST